MGTHVALFRGLNVGGRHAMTMKDLVGHLEALGLKQVRTYIQSGNAVFQCPTRLLAGLPQRINAGIAGSHGFSPAVQVFSLKQFEQAAANNPFPEAASDPKSVHLSFLDRKPRDPDLAGLREVQASDERFELKGTVFYLHAPSGIGRSKLAATAEKRLGVSATGRNWRTICKILDLARK